MFTANHWIEVGDPVEVLGRERFDGAKGDFNPVGRKTMSTNKTPQSYQGQND